MNNKLKYPERGPKIIATREFNKANADFAPDSFQKNKLAPSNGPRQVISALLEATRKRRANELEVPQEPEALQNLIRLEIFTMIRHAYRPSDIKDYLINTYQLSPERAAIFFDECNEAIKAECDEYTLDILRYNTAVVLQVLNDTMVKGDYKNALAAVKELNTMNGVYNIAQPTVQAEEVFINFD